MSVYRHFTIEEEGSVTVLHLVDRDVVGSLVVSELTDELIDLLDKRSPRKIVVDFDGVSHCSTAVINGLLRTKKRLVGKGGSLGLCGMREELRDAYRILNLDGTVFKIYDDRTRALAAMKLVE